jgi:sorting nexin-13
LFFRFINERIENVIISKANQRVAAAQEASHSKPNGSSRISSDHFSRFLDPTGTGVELTQLKPINPEVGQRHLKKIR